MAKLPTEQDIGDLPDRLPRRMGVGSWQPGDLARGAQELARGGETLGMDLGRMAGQDKMLQNQAQKAAANSDLQVGLVNNNQAITNAKTPEEVESLRQNYPVIAASAAQRIQDPDARAGFAMEAAPHIARSNVFADDRTQSLNKDAALSDFDNSTTRSINAAMNTQDVPSRNALLGTIGDSGQSLVDRGFMTKEQWAVKRQEIVHNYGLAQKDADFLEAEQTGDTSKLRAIGQKFTFGSGEWGAGAPSGPVDPAHIAKGALAANQDEAYKAARAEGLSDTAARAVVANLSGESLATPSDNHWDGAHYSQGIASWDPTRTAAIKAQFGKEPKDMSVADQTRAHIWEINNNPAFAQTKAALAGNDPNAMVNALVRNYEEPANPDSDVQNRLGFYHGYGARVGGSTGGGAPAHGVVAAGDSLGVGVAGAAGQDNSGNKFAQQGIPPLPNDKNPSAPNVLDKIGALPDGGGKTLVISTGASNAPGIDPAVYVPKQIAAAKAKGYDVVVLGVGPKFGALNPKLQQQAQAAGARFQPLDAGMIGPDGVHPNGQGYKAIVQQVGGAGGGAAATGAPSAFIGLPPAGATGANPHVAPPQDQWPPDARGVEHNPDGSLSYIMSEGNRVPVPGSRATGAYGAPAPGNTGEFTDAMHPQDRAELGLAYNQKADEIDRRNEAGAKQNNTAAVNDLKARVESMTNGRPIGPKEEASLRPYAESPDPAVRKAYSEAMSIRDNLASYHGKSPAQVQADVVAKEADYNKLREQYPNSPDIERAGLILNAAEKYAKTFATEAYKQPLERAAKSGFLPNGVVPVDPNDPNVGDTLARRVSDAHTAADSLGVPVRYFQDSERPALKAVARQGGDAMVTLAENIVKSGGADAPAMFKEIGLDAPMFQKIGEIAAGGGDPEAVRDIASVIAAKGDKAARGDLPTFTDKMLSKYADPFAGGAVSRMGQDFEGRTRAAANMLMTAAAQRDGWDPKTDPNNANLNQQFFDRAYHLAAGGIYAPDGTKYGGIVDRNAANWTGAADKVIVPNTIKTDDFGKVINSIVPSDLASLPNPPKGANGVPISPAQIQNGRLEAMPDKDGIFRGKYAVFTDGVRDDAHLVRGADNKPWALDLAQPKLDAALRGRNSGSYLGGTTPAAPRPDRYREAPGVTASNDEGLTGAAENP